MSVACNMSVTVLTMRIKRYAKVTFDNINHFGEFFLIFYLEVSNIGAQRFFPFPILPAEKRMLERHLYLAIMYFRMLT